MKGFRVKVLCVSVFVTCMSFQVAQGEEPAASSAPRGLSPAPQSDVPAIPPADTDDSVVQEVAPGPEETLPDQVGKPRGPKVTVSGLEAIDPSGAGTLDQSSGGFPASIYNGSPRLAIMSRIAQLPAAPQSPAMQSILRRLLLSTTKPPVGASPVDEPSMLAHRLNKLIAGGRVDEAAMLGGQSARDDKFARQAWAEALLLLGRDVDACGEATSLRQSSNEAFWLKLRAYCYIVENDVSAASLTLDVMRERAVADDVFFSLSGVLIDGMKAKIDALPAPQALHIALMSKTQVAAPVALAAWLPANKFFRQSQDPLQKLIAIERATLAGILPAEALAEAYAGEVFTPDQYDDPQEWSTKLAPSRVNALYFQAIAQRSRPAARAAAFAAALDRADSQNRFAVFAQLSRVVAKQTPAVAETAWLAPGITRVFLYNGDAKNAAQWQALLTSPTDVATVNALRVHSAIVYPSAENLAHLQSALTWLGQMALKPSGSKEMLMARALREVPLLDALGYTIPPEAQWALTAASPNAPLQGVAAEALTALTRSANQQRVGETVLNALVALGNAGPSRAPITVVSRVVDALATIGMRDEARAIAAEAVLSSSVRPAK